MTGGVLLWRSISFVLVLLCCLFLATCGSSVKMNGTTGNGIQTTISITDTPPAGVAVVFFEAQITAASLQPSDTTKPAVSVLSNPVEVEFGHLQTDTAFLSLTNVPADTYSSITVTFGSATLTVVNHSGAAIGSCANNS